ncbi:MAG: hypothetical protein RL699_110 [Bacteroidota bacterium]|jgi:photosystem II stability/assembly factor-like uncharacterized protein
MKKLVNYLLLLSGLTAMAQLQWAPLTSIGDNINNQRFDDVFFLNENLGWAANGYYATIYKTTDGGQTWVTQLAEFTPALPINTYFRNVEFLNENIGFIGTLSGIFLKTTDGGTTWNPVTITPNPPAICGLDAVGTSTIYGCGAYFSPAYIIKSTDSGLTWQYINMTAYATALVEVLFTDENNGLASGMNESGGVVLQTTDGGQTWTTLYNTPIEGEYVWKLQRLASNPAVIFGSVESIFPNTGQLIKSTDNGLTWTSKPVPDPDIQAVGFMTENHGWMGGHSSPILETFDGGDTWIENTVGSNLNRIVILNDQLAYASGKTIYKYSDQGLGNTDFQESPRQNLKAEVYPNPIQDKLAIQIEFPAADHLRLELYDANGRRIKLLVKADITSKSTQKYQFDFPYAAGIYYVNLHTNTGRQSLKVVK